MTDPLSFVVHFDRTGARKANYVEIAGIDVTRFVEHIEIEQSRDMATTVRVDFLNVTVNLPQEEQTNE
jgi:hypothetical protein